jgi:serine/threonine protein kinase
VISKKKLSEDDLAALMTEITILCELNHPHIIKCYETFDEGVDFYIGMCIYTSIQMDLNVYIVSSHRYMSHIRIFICILIDKYTY